MKIDQLKTQHSSPQSRLLNLLISLSLLLLVSAAADAQILIKGRIINFAQEPIPYASIVDKESGTGTAADLHGSFSLQIKTGTETGTLQVSAIGYHTREVEYQVQNNSVEFKLIHLAENNKELQEVIVTGEVVPTPVDSSIYKIKLISADKIQRSGALNLNDLLLTEANIRMSTDLVLGSQIEMMGLSGQNVKIMVDGVPVIGRLDGNIDLSQVNVDNISQVEVVEGPMSVVYGNNALAGTINLITKQNSYHKIETQTRAYAETVGRYSGNLSLSYKAGRNNFLADGGYEYFAGKDYDTSTRSMDWKPKNLYRVNLGHTLNYDRWKLHGKVGVYSDRLHYKGDIVEGYKVFDTYYYTNRYDASIGLNGGWNDRNHLDVVASYNEYNRSEQELYKDLRTLEEILNDKHRTQDMNQKMLRVIQNHIFIPQKLSLQSGADISIEEMKGERISGGKRSIGDYALFANLRYTVAPALELQPGLRYSYNTGYNPPLVYSANAKWDLGSKLVWRGSVAAGFRAPTVKELHYVFVDSNHEIFGNSELKAESSQNFNSSLEYSASNIHQAWKIASTFFYNDISDLITLVQEQNSSAYTYKNIDDFKSLGADLTIDYGYKGWLKLRGGYGLTGRQSSLTGLGGNAGYQLTHDVFATMKITEQHSRITLNADYKYNGSLPFFYTDENDQQLKEGKQAAYQTLNASFSRSFFSYQLQVVLGAKNLFDVTTVERKGSGGSSHGGGSGVPISYGRSFFISLNYKFFK